MKTVAILGLGASGVAAARLALSKGATTHVSDLQTDAAAAARAADLRSLGAEVELGRHDADRIAAADVVVASPGIPPHAPVLRDLRARGATWIAEPEFAVRFFSGALIAITGTNGKTTTAVLTEHLLKAAGKKVALGGNVGGGFAPAASALPLDRPDADVWVLEMSSFQLADTVDFRPDVGVLTGLAPDHLDRYPDVATYWADKAKLFANATDDSKWILNGDDAEALALIGDAPGHRATFSVADPPADGAAAFVDRGMLRVDFSALGLRGGIRGLLPRSELTLLGRHNVANALAAALAAIQAGARIDGVAEGLLTARPLPHRLEGVGERRGVLWVNDSKATNVAATVGAIGSMMRPLVLLLGGKDKGEELAPLARAIEAAWAEDRIRRVICYGAAGPRFHRELTSALDEVPAGWGRPAPTTLLAAVEGGMTAAVEAGAAAATEGDVLLLSPACSSFDEFENYEARGRRFADLAREAA